MYKKMAMPIEDIPNAPITTRAIRGSDLQKGLSSRLDDDDDDDDDDGDGDVEVDVCLALNCSTF